MFSLLTMDTAMAAMGGMTGRMAVPIIAMVVREVPLMEILAGIMGLARPGRPRVLTVIMAGSIRYGT